MGSGGDQSRPEKGTCPSCSLYLSPLSGGLRAPGNKPTLPCHWLPKRGQWQREAGLPGTPRALGPCPWSPGPPLSCLFSPHQLKSAPTQGQPCEEDQRSLGTPSLTCRVEKGFLEEVTVQSLKGWAGRLDG